jgi:periplasmic protein CpxP/Spy
MKKIFVSFALLMAFAVASFAQATATAPEAPKGRGKGKGQAQMEKRGDNMKTQLGLTDDQAAKVKDLGNATKGKLKAVKSDNSVGKDQKKAQLKQINDEHEASMKGILSADQFTKWQNFRKEERQKMKDMKGNRKGADGESDDK